MHQLIEIEITITLQTKQSDPLHFNEIGTLTIVSTLLKLKQLKNSLK